MSLLIDLLRGSNCTLMNKMKKNLQSNILLLPALTAGFFCYLFPILIAFGKSFFLGTGTDFVGIQNYVDLFENEAFSLAVRNLFHLWAIIVPVNLVIGIFIAEVYIKLRKEMYSDNLTDAQLDQLETICDKINAAQYHTIWYRALQLDQSEDGGNLLSETMVQYWNDEITLDELVDRLTPRLKLYLDE